jgi:hypothetical protein
MGEEAHDENGNVIHTSQYWWDEENKNWILWEKREYYYDEQVRDTLFMCYQLDIEKMEMTLVYKWTTKYNEFDEKIYETHYSYNILSSTWVESRNEYQYHVSGKLLNFDQYHRDSNSNVWMHTIKLEQKYDHDENQIFKELYYLGADGNWFGEEKKQWNYDQSGVLAEELNYVWNDMMNDWIFNRKSDYTYDAIGNLILESIYIHDNDLNDWLINRKIEYSHNAGGDITTKVCFKYDNLLEIWIGDYMFRYEYDSERRETQLIQLNWDDIINDWIQISKKEQKYEPLSYLAIYFWDTDISDWVGNWKIERMCNEYGDYYFEAFYKWDNLSNIWYIQSGNRSEKTYTISGQQKMSINYTLYNDSTDWIPYSTDEWYYDHEGNINIEVYKYWDYTINEWILYTKTFYNHKIGLVTDLPDEIVKAVNIYPNPANDYLAISGLEIPVTVDIYSLQGSILIRKEIFMESMDISYIPQGVYIIALYKKGKLIFSNKFIKR